MIKAEFNNSINDLTTENLYQWDSYQTLQITGVDFGAATPKVHFANKKSTEALVVQGTLKNDGSCEVSIPNSLLGDKYDIIAYIYTNTGVTSKTIKSITIPIIPRLKPTNYTQPSNEQIAEIEAIELQAKAIIDGLTASEYSSSENYKRPNIVYYNHNAYMCKSPVDITGVLPTDTTKWQEICHGEAITGMSVNSEGKLVFTTSTGNSYSINFQAKNVTLVDEADIPALKITNDDYHTLRRLKCSNSDIAENQSAFISTTGFYIINVQYLDSSGTTSGQSVNNYRIISIPLLITDMTKTYKSVSTGISTNSADKFKYSFSIVCTPAGSILPVSIEKESGCPTVVVKNVYKVSEV